MPLRYRRTPLRGLMLVIASAVVVGVGATTAAAAPGPDPDPDSSPRVAQYQQALADAGFYRGAIDGLDGRMTQAAVLAFEKAAGLETDGLWEPLHMRYLLQFRAQPVARDGEPNRVEVDLTNQIGYLIIDDELVGAFGVSSGNDEVYEHPYGYTGVATTPRGDFTFNRYYDGLWEAPLGELYRPWYFKGGFAIHGSSSVPDYPASHGCVRVTNWDADWLSEHLEIGMPVHIWDGPTAERAPLVYEAPVWLAVGIRPA